MELNQDFFVPEYMQDFECIGKDCIDSCCIGWNVEIDKKTFKKYENSQNKKIKLISQQFLVKTDTKSDISYGKLADHNNCCPFLSEEKLCNAYSLLGKENLSIGCSTYPRVIKKFNKIGFIAGDLSCPEIARLCLNKPNLKIKKVRQDKLPNIFNSKNVFSLEISKNIPDKISDFIEKIFYQINSCNTLFEALEQIIVSYEKIFKNRDSKSFSKDQSEKIKDNSLLFETKILANICFSNLTSQSRYTTICKISANKSKYFKISESEFIEKFINTYRTKFSEFREKNEFIFKNFFINEFIKNIEGLISSKDFFDDLIREVILFLSLTNFLLVCQLFEENKKLTINSYVEILSAVIKKIQSSHQKKNIKSFLKKLDNNNLFKRLVDLY